MHQPPWDGHGEYLGLHGSEAVEGGTDEVVEELQKLRGPAGLTIMMTSADRQGAYQRCRELGIAATLLKPLKQSELRESIIRILGGMNKSQIRFPPPATASRSATDLRLSS